jgi:hypothetical protein
VSLQQSQPVVPPQPTDKNLRDFSQIIQQSMMALFQAAHVHKIVTSDPAANTGNIGDIYLVDGMNKYIAIKFNSGWFKIGPLTAI